jgi:hypothetical protein
MSSPESGITGQLTRALHRALSETPYWDVAESLASALCAGVSFRNHGTSMVTGMYLDHLRIVLLQVKITMLGRGDVTAEEAEHCFWQMCPAWLATQFGVPDGMQEAAASTAGDWGK